MEATNSENLVAGRDTRVCAVGELSASDPSVYEQIVQPFELLNTPISSDDFAYRIRHFHTSAITLYSEKLDSSCRLRGLSHEV